MAHEFLSDDWMDAVKAIRDKYADTGAEISYKIRMNQVITDAPFTDDEIRVYMDTTDGTMRMDKGQLDDADLTITTDWETARKLFVDQDQAAGMQAFLAGKVKVTGDITKLVLMNATMPDETAKAVAAEIKDLTA